MALSASSSMVPISVGIIDSNPDSNWRVPRASRRSMNPLSTLPVSKSRRMENTQPPRGLFASYPSLSLPPKRARISQGGVLVQASGSDNYALSMDIPKQRKFNKSISLDKLIQEAVIDVVRTIQDDPFFHLIYDIGGGKRTLNRKVTHDLFKLSEGWASIKDTILQDSPDGVILVRSLAQEEVDQFRCSNPEGTQPDEDCLDCPFYDNGTSFWGVVVQARNCKCHACYILKTTKVKSLGVSCTNFTLTKAKHFGPAAHKQLEASWIL